MFEIVNWCFLINLVINELIIFFWILVYFLIVNIFLVYVFVFLIVEIFGRCNFLIFFLFKVIFFNFFVLRILYLKIVGWFLRVGIV